jgi:hypothetical protein
MYSAYSTEIRETENKEGENYVFGGRDRRILTGAYFQF